MTRVAIASDAWNIPRYKFVGTHIYTEAMLAAARSAGVDAYALPRREFYGKKVGGLVGPLVYQLTSRYASDIGPDDIVHQATHCASADVDIVSIHDIAPFYHRRLSDRLFRFQTEFSARKAKRVMVTTDWMGNCLASRFPWVRPKLCVVPYPFETPPVERLPDVYNGLWISRLAPNKDPHLYLELASMLPEYRFALRGSTAPGWEAFGAHVTERAISEGLVRDERMTFLPLLNESERNRLYRSVPVIVSTSHYEGFHAPIMEGYVRGMKIVVPYIEPYLELYGPTDVRPCDASNVYWYAPRDVESLAAAFRRAMNSSLEAPDPGIVRRVSHAAVGQNLRTLYEEVARR